MACNPLLLNYYKYTLPVEVLTYFSHKYRTSNVMNKRRVFFQELFSEGGKISMVRVKSAIVTLCALIISFIGMGTNGDPMTGHVVSLLTVAYGGKVLQKSIEVNSPNTESDGDAHDEQRQDDLP